MDGKQATELGFSPWDSSFTTIWKEMVLNPFPLRKQSLSIFNFGEEILFLYDFLLSPETATVLPSRRQQRQGKCRQFFLLTDCVKRDR